MTEQRNATKRFNRRLVNAELANIRAKRAHAVSVAELIARGDRYLDSLTSEQLLERRA